MSATEQVLAASRQAHSENPERLHTNRNVDCFRHITRVIQLLKAQGLDASYIGKTHGEGQYTPATGFPRQVGPWTITGVSHDAIWVNQVQYDTIASGNDGPDPLGQPGVPIANEIPAQYYRPHNPPVAYPVGPVVDDPPVPVPTPQPREIAFPPRDETAAFGKSLDRFYEVKGRQNRASDEDPLFVDNEGLYVWIPEYLRYRVNGKDHAEATRIVMDSIEAAWPK